jgi:hypothetical protein
MAQGEAFLLLHQQFCQLAVYFGEDGFEVAAGGVRHLLLCLWNFLFLLGKGTGVALPFVPNSLAVVSKA